MRQRSRWLEILVCAAIVIFSAALRLYQLDQLPPGLHYDEAFKGVEARNIIAGARPIFFADNQTEEPMMAYGSAFAFVLVGDSPYAIRLVAAIAGIITVAGLYWLARALFQSMLIAALASFTLAILYWHLNFSRLGMEPILTPAMLTLAMMCAWIGLTRDENESTAVRRPPTADPSTPSPLCSDSAQDGNRRLPSAVRRRFLAFALAGFFLAATQYTYKAALFVPVFIAAFIGVELLVNRKFVAQNWRGLVLCALVAVLFFAPLGLYFAAHLNEFLERPSAVNTFSAGATTMLDSAVKVAGMFFIHGDDNPRSNLPGRPALDPFLAIGFVIGLVVCAARIKKIESRFLLLWFGVMTLPSVLTDFPPHFGRDIGATPAIALLVAVGLAFIIAQARNRITVSLFTVVLFTGFAFSTYSTINDYFNNWGTRTGLFDSFDAGYLALAQKLHQRPGDEAVYLSPVTRDYFTIDFGLAGRAASSFDGRRALVIAPTPATYGIVTREDAQSLARLSKIFPQGRVIDHIADFTGKPYASIFRADGTANIELKKMLRVRLGDGIELLGYDIARDGDTIVLNVCWRSIAPVAQDLTTFVHLIGVTNPATQSPVWAQDDARPGHGSYPTNRWTPGEMIIDEYRLTIPGDAPNGVYQIELGMYQIENGARVSLTDANGAPMESNRVIFERITRP